MTFLIFRAAQAAAENQWPASQDGQLPDYVQYVSEVDISLYMAGPKGLTSEKSEMSTTQVGGVAIRVLVRR